MAKFSRDTVFQALYNLLQTGNYPFAMVNAPVKITKVSTAGGVATVDAVNNYHAGQDLYFYGLQNATFLNGATLQCTGPTGATGPSGATKFTAVTGYTGAYGPTGDSGFATDNEGRYFKAWDQDSSSAQPALYLQESVQKADQDAAIALNRWNWEVKAWIYFRRDESVPPATSINQCIDAIENVINPPGLPGQKQTLASQNYGKPLVTNVRIVEVIFDENPSDQKGGQVIVMVRMEILTT